MKKGPIHVLLISLFFIIVGCQKDLYRFTTQFKDPKISKGSPVVLLITDANLHGNVLESENLKKTLDYTKIPHSTARVSQFNLNPIIDESVRVVSVYETMNINDRGIDSLYAYVAKGGTLQITKALSDPRMFFLMGIRPETDPKKNINAKGFYLNRSIFPNKLGFSYSFKDPFLGYDGDNFRNEAVTIVSAMNDANYPVVLKHKVGNGNVVLLNLDFALQKNMRGLLFSTLLYGLEGIPYPVANVSTIFLDDFPSPMYNIFKEPIKSEMNLTMADYVKDVWWPDMKKLAKRHDIKYTSYLTFDYNNTTTPPFVFKEWDATRTLTQKEGNQSSSAWITKNIISSGHELGFHGYNHVPLLEQEWKNPVFISTALKSALKKWNILDFQNMPISYVPPSNYIDSMGMQRLVEAMPSLRFMQSTYLGHFEEGGNREFDPEPWNKHFFDYPRISSGFNIEPEKEWAIESMYIYTGIWTHFIHPDDIYQIPDGSNKETSADFDYRNKYRLNWYSANGKKGMLDTFEDYLVDFKKNHPFTRFFNATQSSYITSNWRYGRFNHMYDNGIYEVESFAYENGKEPYYWFMYVDNEHIKDADVIFSNKNIRNRKSPILNGFLYTIETPAPYLFVKDFEKRLSAANESALFNKVLQKRDTYYALRKSLVPLENQLKKLVSNDNIPEAVELIEDYLSENGQSNKALLKKYATYMSWQNKGNAFWDKYNLYYLKSQDSLLPDLSYELSKIVYYPTNEVRQLWLERQLKFNTKNCSVLNEYYDDFNTPENILMIKHVLWRLCVLEPSLKNEKRYIRILLQTNAQELVNKLNTVVPCSLSDKALATDIAWAYANRLLFDKALQWQSCSENIDQATIDYWRLQTKDLIKFKTQDYNYYLRLLIANDTKKAAQELRGKSPCKEGLKEYADKITKLFGDLGDYNNALAWSACAENISVIDKMNWYFEVGQIDILKDFFKKYIRDYPTDFEVSNHMATLLLYNGEVNEAAKITIGVPMHVRDVKLLAVLNNEVKQMDLQPQLEFYRVFQELLNLSLVIDIQKKERKEQGSSLGMEYFSINNKLDPTLSSFGLYYDYFNKKGNRHRFMLIRSAMLPIEMETLLPDNMERQLFGVDYRFDLHPNNDKNHYFHVRIEKDDTSTFYFQAGIGFNKNKGKKFTALQLEIFPVRSGPGHVLNIYRCMFNVYKEIPLGNRFLQILALESNYYTDGEYDATILANLRYDIFKESKFQFGPLLEGALGRGSIDRRSGYPYWLAKKRIYGGGGAQLTLGNDKTRFKLITDFGIFAENEQPNFERYTGNLSYRLADYTTLNSSFEVYTIKNFYSNVFRMGLQYKF